MKQKLIAIFGTDACREFGETGMITDLDLGHVAFLEFDTVAERDAYMRGVDDAEGWMEATCVVMDKPRRTGGGRPLKWTDEKLSAEAAKYETRAAFCKGNYPAYMSAYKRNRLDVVCAHMDA